MAGDWIKMRTGLQRHPRVVRISSALQSDRFRVIGGLHAVWSLADEQTEGGELEGYTFATVDEMIGWPGFCSALKAVDWAVEGKSGVTFPRFEKHNGQSAKRRAQEADRKRDARASAPEADKKRTREEKRREEKKEQQQEVALRLPAWLPLEAWKAWLEVRKGLKCKNTTHALTLAITELERLRSLGHDPAKVLDQSTLKSWKSVYPLKLELVAATVEPASKLCDYCANVSVGHVGGRRYCSNAHMQKAMDNEKPARIAA